LHHKQKCKKGNFMQRFLTTTLLFLFSFQGVNAASFSHTATVIAAATGCTEQSSASASAFKTIISKLTSVLHPHALSHADKKNGHRHRHKGDGVNGIASLICGVLGAGSLALFTATAAEAFLVPFLVFSLLGAFAGIEAFKRHERNRGLALAGLILSAPGAIISEIIIWLRGGW
jgi:hypothetical protein